MKAYLKNYRQSSRKVRLIAPLIRGKSASYARTILNSLSKRSALPVKKLLESAIANAKSSQNIEEGKLAVKEFRVDEGVTMKRFMPRARGSAFPIRKRTSNILIVLEEKVEALDKLKSRK